MTSAFRAPQHSIIWLTTSGFPIAIMSMLNTTATTQHRQPPSRIAAATPHQGYHFSTTDRRANRTSAAISRFVFEPFIFGQQCVREWTKVRDGRNWKEHRSADRTIPNWPRPAAPSWRHSALKIAVFRPFALIFCHRSWQKYFLCDFVTGLGIKTYQTHRKKGKKSNT